MENIGRGRRNDNSFRFVNYKNGGKNISINYSFDASPFGNILVTSTAKGICYITFVEDEIQAFSALQCHFPNACFKQHLDPIQQIALAIFYHD